MGGHPMQNFTFNNPTHIVFGKGRIPELAKLVHPDEKILMTYGGGSIKTNGVYDQVKNALGGHHVVEFGGIEPNPEYETCMQAVKKAREEKIDFLLSIGGGSVLDATKFIAAAIPYEGEDPWDIISKGTEGRLRLAVPLGCVLTLPATGSEANGNAVLSRKALGQKLPFSSRHVYPRFSILDPETTYSLPERQVINGIVDAYVHVIEQYMTYEVNTPLQDRFAEGILLTLIEEGPKVRKDPHNYDARANIMWCATMALNGVIACGVVEDWATHMIGHELTALHGLDHAQTLAILLPAVWKHQRVHKTEKLLKYARRIWGIKSSDSEASIDEAIDRTVNFFNSIGMHTRLSDYDLTPAECMKAAEQLHRRGVKLGEHKNIGKKEVEEILLLCA
jgi:NADP-dependent alcohol dehydrogenase